jgi:hypothetical protein
VQLFQNSRQGCVPCGAALEAAGCGFVRRAHSGRAGFSCAGVAAGQPLRGTPASGLTAGHLPTHAGWRGACLRGCPRSGPRPTPLGRGGAQSALGARAVLRRCFCSAASPGVLVCGPPQGGPCPGRVGPPAHPSRRPLRGRAAGAPGPIRPPRGGGSPTGRRGVMASWLFGVMAS